MRQTGCSIQWKKEAHSHKEPPSQQEVELSNEVNIRTGRITRAKIKKAMKKLKNGKAAGCENILPEPIQVRVKRQRRFSGPLQLQ